MTPKGTKVFLSYERTDRDQAQKIGQELRQSGFDVWDPDKEILPGDDFGVQLKDALDSADAIVVFISPEGLASRSVSYEIEYALGARHLRGRPDFSDDAPHQRCPVDSRITQIHRL